VVYFFFQAEDGIRDFHVTGVQTCALPIFGDLVEHHPVDRDLRLQDLLEVPGDRLALPVLVRREVELVGLREQLLQLLHLLALVGVHDVQRFEVALDVHAELGPRLALVLGRHLRGATREVPDMADTGLHDVATTQVPGDRLRLRGRLDDHKTGTHAVAPATLRGAVIGWHRRSNLAVSVLLNRLPITRITTSQDGAFMPAAHLDRIDTAAPPSFRPGTGFSSPRAQDRMTCRRARRGPGRHGTLSLPR